MDCTTEAVLGDDPASLLSYLRKCVEIKIDTGETYNGKVFTIDPITKTIVLTHKTGDKIKIEVITATSIKEIQITHEDKEDDL